MKRVTVEYFAFLRDRSNVAREEVTTDAATVRELYEEVAKRHRFTLPYSAIKAVINEEFVEMGLVLEDGMKVAFLPPVAGG